MPLAIPFEPSSSWSTGVRVSRAVSRPPRPRRLLAQLATAVLASTAFAAFAQTATIYGSVGNFDVVNNTGQDACGFEMELEGVAYSPNIYSYSWTRYGAAVLSPYTVGAVSGTRVTWKSSDCSAMRTVPHAPGTAFAGTCYGTTQNNGCEHFGVNASTTKVTSRWLVKDPANASTYVAFDPPMPVPMPYYFIQPAVVVGAAPIIVDVVEAPEPPQAPDLYGDAQWMKVFVRQMPREVTLDELLTTNPLVVPMDATQLEFGWKLLQADPVAGGNGRRNRGRHQGASTLDPTTRSVVRRYEMYDYVGVYDPLTNEALCADILCKIPTAGEIGDFVSAQMAAVNVQGDFVVVSKAGTGGGNVDSSDKRIVCGSKCTSPYTAGALATLTAQANSGSTFAGWTGACTGTAACTVTVNGANTVGATFNVVAAGGGGGGGGVSGKSFTLSVGRSNSGSVTASPTGADRALNCGSACSAKFASGTTVTLTATPLAGKAFTGWGGACASAGSNATCSVTVTVDTSVQANFEK